MFTLYIYSDNNGMHPAFVKANSYIIKKYKKEIVGDKICQNTQRFNLLKKLWKTEWNIKVAANWTELHFPSKNSLNIFLLRWC
jgi:hypothetical protein